MTHVDSPAYRYLTALLAIAGLAVATYLSASDLAGEATVCIEGGGCEAVTQSAWGNLFGAPVALLGVAGYVLIVLAAGAELFWRDKTFPDSTLALVLLTAAGATFSVYLTVVSATQINNFCIWCISSLVILLLLFGLSFYRALRLADNAG